MKMYSSDLLHLPVETRTGQNLGRVAGFDIDVESGRITHYHVRTGLMQGLWHQELLVATSQVVSISNQKMVVEDAAAAPELRVQPQGNI